MASIFDNFLRAMDRIPQGEDPFTGEERGRILSADGQLRPARAFEELLRTDDGIREKVSGLLDNDAFREAMGRSAMGLARLVGRRHLPGPGARIRWADSPAAVVTPSVLPPHDDFTIRVVDGKPDRLFIVLPHRFFPLLTTLPSPSTPIPENFTLDVSGATANDLVLVYRNTGRVKFGDHPVSDLAEILGRSWESVARLGERGLRRLQEEARRIDPKLDYDFNAPHPEILKIFYRGKFYSLVQGLG